MPTVKDGRHSSLLRLGIYFVIVAFTGAIISLAGWYLFDSPMLAKLGFPIVLVGVVAGLVIIVIGQIRFGATAIRGSIQSARELEGKVRGAFEIAEKEKMK